jgi:exportin-7
MGYARGISFQKGRMQEIENVCVMFQYATPATMQSIQAKLAEFFNSNISSRQELHEQLARSLNLMQFSKRDIVHTLVQSHIKALLTTKHSLFQAEDLTSLSESLGTQIQQFSSNRFVMSNFVQLNAMIYTLGWTLSDEFPQRYSELLADAESRNPSPLTLPSILSLLQEINSDTSAIKNFPKHRKTAIAFRDSHLLTIFKLAFNQFKSHLSSPDHITENALLILNMCLGFDFLGYQSDQDGHGMTSATQIPSSWKSLLLEENLLEVLVGCFSSLPGSYHQPLLDALSYLLGTRRSLFNEGERITFAEKACQCATKLTLLPFEDMEQTDFLRVMLKFTCVYSVDFGKCDYALDFITSFLAYTKQKLVSITSNDFLFLAQIWVQIRDSEHKVFVEKLEAFQELISMFVNIDKELLESLYFEEQVTLEQVIPSVGRILRLTGFQYSVNLIVHRLDTFGHRSSPQDRVEVAWTIALFSGMLSHRISYQASSDDDRNDGIAAGNIFGFAQFKQFRTIADSCDEVLELSLLGFFEQFKHTYLTGDGSNCPITWQAIVSSSSVTCQGDVVLIFLQRALFFLKESSSESLVLKSSQLFQELVNGVHTCKLLQTSNLLQYIDESGIFGLFINCSYNKSKTIMKLYESIGRLFFSHQFNDSPEANLKRLLIPISEYFASYSQTGNELNQMDLVVRKLRGILSAIYTPKLYQTFFDWLRPYFPLLSRFLESEACVNGPANTLRFVRELATNKVNRLSFDISTEYGVLMFREVIGIVSNQVVKLEILLSGEITESNWTKVCLKPLHIILDTFKAAINSKAVPFGIMKLYEDPAVSQMIQMGFLLTSSVTYAQVSEFNKLASAYFGFWVHMTSDWMDYLMPTIPYDIFERLSYNVFKILENLDNAVSSQACTIVNSIFTHVLEKGGGFYTIDPSYQRKKLIQILFSRIFTAELETQWSFTRPLLPLILCDTEWFAQYLKSLIQMQQPPYEPYEKVLLSNPALLWSS